jgi:hypothetical protein
VPSPATVMRMLREGAGRDGGEHVIVSLLCGWLGLRGRDALREGRAIWRGKGYSLRGTAPLSVHQAALEACAVLAVDGVVRPGARPTGCTPTAWKPPQQHGGRPLGRFRQRRR